MAVDRDVFGEMTALANATGAVNLGQAMPDFDGPAIMHRVAADAMAAGHNQYPPSAGCEALRRAVSARRAVAGHGQEYDWADEITVTAGATEALAATVLAVAGPGDEVILVEPFYDAYPAMVAIAGATPVAVALVRDGDRLRLDHDGLAAAVTDRTRAILINTPHNPSGRIFDEAELGHVAQLARDHDLVVISDEVYEELWFDRPHLSPASLPGMRERTVVCSSAAKSLSVCGWRVGWALAPPDLTALLRVTHRFLTFSAPLPLQLGVAAALEHAGRDGYFDRLRVDYRARRDLLADALTSAGLAPMPSEGSTFLLADTTGWRDDDPFEVARWLVETAGVAALPLTSFCLHPETAWGILRFAYCKRVEVLDEAARRLTAAAGQLNSHMAGGTF